MIATKFYKKSDGSPFYAGFDENGKNVIDIINYDDDKIITNYQRLEISDNCYSTYVECSKSEFMKNYNDVLEYFNLQEKK